MKNHRALAAGGLLVIVVVGGDFAPRVTEAARSPQVRETADEASIPNLLERIEQILVDGDVAGYLGLLAPAADREAARQFVESEFRAGVGLAVVKERDRAPLAGTLPGSGYSLVIDAFTEQNGRGRVSTWQLDIKRAADAWLFAGQTRISAVENLHRLSLNPLKQFDARNFTITAEDLELTLAEGSVFVAEVDEGVTGLVLMGRGEMHFHPEPETERGQIRMFADADAIASRFDAAFVRVGSLDAHADRAALQPRQVDSRDLRRAEQIFREESPKSFAVDLADLSGDNWSLLPGGRDFLAEIRTSRFGTLTYSRSESEAEDVSFFERRRHRNIAGYASKERLATRGRFYNDDELAPVDVLHYDIAISSTPDRQWIAGRTSMRLRVRAPSLGQLTIRLADSLMVRSIVSREYGRLFSLRVANQDTILVNLPLVLLRDSQLNVTIEYSGVLEPQPTDREAVALEQRGADEAPFLETFYPRPEMSHLYSNRSYWYPQAMTTDYATATMQITVPVAYSCIASGERARGSPEIVEGRDAPGLRKSYTFTTDRPLRYLAFLVARLARADQWTVVFPDAANMPAPDLSAANASTRHGRVDLMVEATPRQTAWGKELAERAADIVQFYESILGDAPYPAFTVALLETELPGGHSPGYFAVLNRPVPREGVSWRNDPAAFPNYPEFFLAHETAHQWWGQAIGWRNYHEQWLSEGFAQYFAALYAQKFRGPDVFASVMRHMRRWAISESEQGPVYLGYRVGHIRNDRRAFRAIVYNKAAVVLHMLRNVVGDEAFFRGIRRFYAAARFTKAGTDDLRLAIEAESGRPLDRFFERWIYNATLPQILLSYRVDGTMGSTGSEGSRNRLALRFEQTGEIFDVPVTVKLRYEDGSVGSVDVAIADRIEEVHVPLKGRLRSVEVSKDDGALVDVKIQ